MEVKILQLGLLQANCYLLVKDNDCLIIDPGTAEDILFKKLKNYNLKGIILTHNHFDHIGGVNTLIEKYNVEVYNFKNLKEGLNVLGTFDFEVIKTPGHSSDSISIYFEKENIMFTGDFIFKGTIGRTDLETGNIKEMKKSLQRLKNYNEDMVIYPGHGEFTTLKYEKENNYYLNNEMPF